MFVKFGNIVSNKHHNNNYELFIADIKCYNTYTVFASFISLLLFKIVHNNLVKNTYGQIDRKQNHIESY